MSDVVFEDVSKVYPSIDGVGENLAVANLNLTLPEGEMVTLLGPSGCGKTTTLRMLAGFETPTTGQILVNGKDISRVAVNARGIGMVFQSYALFPHMTVSQNVAYGLEVTKASKQEIRDRTAEVMKLMDLGQYAERSPSQLSGGQQQRVALARAVVTEPAVLLFDEPLSNLDAQLRERMRDELRAIQQRLKITSLYVTHDQSEAMAISDRVVIMREGIVEQNATTREIFTRPASPFVAEFIGNANLWKGTVRGVGTGAADIGFEGGSGLTARYDAGKPLRPGEEVTVVARPEWIDIVPDDQGTSRVTRTVYFGSHAEYSVDSAHGDSTVVVRIGPETPLLAVGDRVRLDVQAGTAWAIGTGTA